MWAWVRLGFYTPFAILARVSEPAVPYSAPAGRRSRRLLLRKLYGHFWAAQIGRPLGAATQTSDLWRLWRVHRSIKVAFEQPLSARRGSVLPKNCAHSERASEQSDIRGLFFYVCNEAILILYYSCLYSFLFRSFHSVTSFDVSFPKFDAKSRNYALKSSD